MANLLAFVPGFDCDIFISYPMEGESWTQHFVDDPRGELARSVEGKPPKFISRNTTGNWAK
jgi:hypothetical protein